MNELGQAFIARSRYHLKDDYLPKIERCLSLVSDQQIWWRANEQSNSIGNLLLHLSGNVRQWIVTGLGGATDVRDRDSEFAQRDAIPRDELLAKLKETLREADATLSAFDADKLLDSYRIQGFEESALDADRAIAFQQLQPDAGREMLLSGCQHLGDGVADPVDSWEGAPRVRIGEADAQVQLGDVDEWLAVVTDRHAADAFDPFAVRLEPGRIVLDLPLAGGGEQGRQALLNPPIFLAFRSAFHLPIPLSDDTAARFVRGPAPSSVTAGA